MEMLFASAPGPPAPPPPPHTHNPTCCVMSPHMQVSCIVQYDVPGAPEEYVHRVGRTARMGHGGEALLLLMPHERPYVDLLATRGIALGCVRVCVLGVLHTHARTHTRRLCAHSPQLGGPASGARVAIASASVAAAAHVHAPSLQRINPLPA
jgi:hypothetical protein